ncbi:hypothetical protein BDN71DRAFT_1514310 [Pleurotus eryngii]|uniref:Uncharacterized protein n=1 Tax=Pleurotus eryngii TaxID=5323 RepID=A0A9P6D7Y2_PLEER|nr:hypothetical protein BDN71DRAFT_1514310 [Pleurotus eryngii]
MGSLSKRKSSQLVPPPLHSQAVFSPAVTHSHSMTTQKPLETAVLNISEATSSDAPVTNTPQSAMNPSMAVTSAPHMQMGHPLNASIPTTKGDPAPLLLGAVTPSVETSPPIPPDTNKGKEKEILLPTMSSLESLPHVTSYPDSGHCRSVIQLTQAYVTHVCQSIQARSEGCLPSFHLSHSFS